MHPSWFLDHRRRSRRSPSLESQYRAPSYPSPNTFQRDGDVDLPSYNDIYSTETLPSAMGNVLLRNDHPNYESPLEASGFDFSAYDPEGMAYLDAISSRSRNSEEEEEYRQKEQQGQGRLEEYNQEADRLIDIQDNHGDTHYPLPSPSTEIQQHADFDPFSPITQSQIESHSPSQSDTTSQNYTYNGQDHPKAQNRYRHTSQIFDTPMPHLANERSKRKHVNEYEGGEHEYDGAGPSTQIGWKRQRVEQPSPEEEEEEVEVWQDQCTSHTDDSHHRIPVGHDWLIPPLNADVSSLAIDGLRGGGRDDEEDTGAQSSRSGSEMEEDIWRSDALTVVNEKHVDWQGEELMGALDQHQTRYSRESSDEATYQEGELATDSVPTSEEERPVSSEEQHPEAPIPTSVDMNESHPISQEIGDLDESRKRSAEEHRTTPSPIRKKTRRPPAPKIVLAKALPRVLPPSKVLTSPQSSPSRTKPKNATLGMMPRRNFNSAPNRASTSASTSTTARQIITDKGPVEFFASLKASKKPVKVKQKAFKSPLASGGGGITLKVKDPNQSSINYGQSTDQHHISIPTSIPAQIAILEKEAQKLRQALKYQNQSEDDDHLQELIIQWRTAGRDVVEQIFDRVPKPTEGEEQASGHGGSNPWMMGNGDNGPQLTEEQERWLKDCPKNEDGEPVDEEGNTVIPEPQDLKTLIEHESRPIRGEKEGYFPRYEHDSRGKNKQVFAETREWNIGTVMLKMSVDPTLLGWDDDLEDWVDSESL